MITINEDAIDQALEQAHALLLIDLAGEGTQKDVFILAQNPPGDDPE
jgi:hypothetical protein